MRIIGLDIHRAFADPDIEDCLTHEFRLAPISDRRHEISADETVDDGQAVRGEQQHEERGEKAILFSKRPLRRLRRLAQFALQ